MSEKVRIIKDFCLQGIMCRTRRLIQINCIQRENSNCIVCCDDKVNGQERLVPLKMQNLVCWDLGVEETVLFCNCREQRLLRGDCSGLGQ